MGAPIINTCMEKHQSIQVSCIQCRKIYSVRGIGVHYYVEHTAEGKKHWAENHLKSLAKHKSNGEKLKKQCEQKYYTNPKICLNCQCVISYERKQNRFCSRSCAATYNNKKLVGLRRYGPQKKNNLTTYERIKLKNNIVGPYSTVYRCKCNVCDKVTVSRYQRKFCKDHSESYSHNGRAKYWFTFRLMDYPDLFDFELLKKHGMRSRGKNNIGGVVRDHKVSVADAIANGYDPHYIKHPLNCELLLNRDNAKKHKLSSMTYEELVKQVDEYEKKKLTKIIE